MKKAIFSLFLGLAFLCAHAFPLHASWFKADKITMYSQRGCPHCTEALKYIQKNHPKLAIEIVELNNKDALERFYACADKFSIARNRVGTPLICFEKDYVMGWSSENAKKFEKLVPSK